MDDAVDVPSSHKLPRSSNSLSSSSLHLGVAAAWSASAQEPQPRSITVLGLLSHSSPQREQLKEATSFCEPTVEVMVTLGW
ncbi:MAG: hypothetical protein P8H66_09720 [Luminiphilus sp.]|nr:hypothetical protein [Luminiphilus sp.]